MANKTFRKGSIILGILLLVGGIVISNKIGNREVPQKEQTAAKADINHVQVITAKNEAVQSQIGINGMLSAKKKIEIYADVSGTLRPTQKDFREGVYYDEGDIMMTIDDEEARFNLEAQKSQLKASVIAFIDNINDTQQRLDLQAQKSRLKGVILSVLYDLESDFPDNYPTWKSYVNGFDLTANIRPLPKASTDREQYFIDARGISDQYLSIQSLEESLTKYDSYTTNGSETTDILKWKNYANNFDVKKPVAALPTPTSGREAFFYAARNLENQYLSIKSREKNLSKYVISAPFKGVVTQSTINPGALVRIGQKLGEFISPYTYELTATVPLQEVNFFKKGSAVRLTSDAVAGEWSGKVARVGKSIDATTQTQKVFIRVSGSKLNEGMFLNGFVTTEKIENAIAVPRKLLNDDRELYVIEKGKLVAKSIELVKFDGNNAVIRGIADNTKVLAQPILGAYNGMAVKVIE